MASLTNNTNQTRILYFREPEPVKIAKITVEILMALFGILGNLCVCIVITRRLTVRTVMNLYIRNLAIADLGLLMLCFPLAIVQQELIKWPLGEFFCKYIYPGSDVFYGASIWSITVIAIERYRNIVTRERIRHESSTKTVQLVIVVVWVASFVTQCVPLYTYMEYDVVSKRCQAGFPNGSSIVQVYSLMFLAFLYIVPLALISWTYIQISRRIHQSSKFNKKIHNNEFEPTVTLSETQQLKQRENRISLLKKLTKRKEDSTKTGKRKNSLGLEERKRLKQNHKARRILTPLVVIFAISMLPYHAGRIVVIYWPKFVQEKYFWLFFSVCGFLIVVNSCMNPLIYAMVSKEFRKAFKRLVVVRQCSRYSRETHRGSARNSNTRHSSSLEAKGRENPTHKRGFFKVNNSLRLSTKHTEL